MTVILDFANRIFCEYLIQLQIASLLTVLKNYKYFKEKIYNRSSHHIKTIHKYSLDCEMGPS